MVGSINITVILCIFIRLLSFDLDAKKKYYRVVDIPAGLTENAVAVVREHTEIFKILSPSRGNLKVKHVVTVLNERGDHYGVFNEWYSPLRSLFVESINIYNKHGDLIQVKYGPDIVDLSLFSANTLYSDNRQLLFEPQINTYPYTVEVIYNIKYNGLLNYPGWQPIYGYDLAVEKSLFRVTTAQGITFRYLMSNYDKKPIRITDRNSEVFEWSVVDFKAIKREGNSPALYEFTPTVYLAPNIFSIEGYEGSMESWESFGVWSFKLLEGKDNISEATVLKIQQLTNGLTDRREIIKKIYEYMQSKTRYVSIQEGIGGWQPFGADLVEDLGYGDCKALANYTRTLLKTAGVESFYTKVRAGAGLPEIDKNFVYNFSNHIILCVPDQNDTIWLECTSQVHPFNYLGTFTSDRYALLVTPDGGKLVRTQTFRQEDNLQIISADAVLSPNGECKVSVRSSYNGLQYENANVLLRMHDSDRKKWIVNRLGLNDVTIEKVVITDNTIDIPVLNTEYELSIANYGVTTGDRIFLRANMLQVSDYIPDQIRNRQSEVQHSFTYPFTNTDTIRYLIPENYTIESLPVKVYLDTEFGIYRAEVNVNGNLLTYTRKLSIPKGEYSASSYNDFRKFFIDIAKADNSKIVLKRSANGHHKNTP